MLESLDRSNRFHIKKSFLLICLAILLFSFFGCLAESGKESETMRDDSRNAVGEPLFRYDSIAGARGDAVMVHATGLVESVDNERKTVVFKDYESEVAEKVGSSAITLDCSGPLALPDGISVEQIKPGQVIIADFGWPQDSNILVASIRPQE